MQKFMYWLNLKQHIKLADSSDSHQLYHEMSRCSLTLMGTERIG